MSAFVSGDCMICNVCHARCPRFSCDDASAQQEVASLDVLNRFDRNVECGMSAGLAESSQIRLPARDGNFFTERC